MRLKLSPYGTWLLWSLESLWCITGAKHLCTQYDDDDDDDECLVVSGGGSQGHCAGIC